MKNKKYFPFILLSLVVASCDNGQFHAVFEEEEDNDELVYTLDKTKLNESQKIYENDNFEFSFKESVDNLSIKDKRNGYTWNSGINKSPYSLEYINNLDRNERETFYIDNPIMESTLNSQTYIGFANSLFTIEVYKKTGSNYKVDYYGSSYISKNKKRTKSELYKVVGEENHFKFKVDFSEIPYQIDSDDEREHTLDIQIVADLYFNSEGFDIKILDKNITGYCAYAIKDILIAPFMGSQGGMISHYNEVGALESVESIEFDDSYAVIPDGPGSIIRFKDNQIANLTGYKGYVYGKDPSRNTTQDTTITSVSGIKNCKMPIYGIVNESNNAAFVGFAKRGGEYMAINFSPDNSNNLQYALAYPTFDYNCEYTQIYNQAGASYSTIADDRNHFTLEMQYDFLANDDANYVGMAKNYRNYLINTSNELNELNTTNDDISLRLDFIMSDTESSLVGNNSVVTTKVSQLKDILEDVHDNLDVSKAVVSLYGWQKQGKTAQNPSKADLSSSIGGSLALKSLIKDAKDLNYEIAFAENYYNINTHQMAYLNNASKHINGYYDKIYQEMPFANEFGIARADRSNDFVKKQVKKLSRKVDNYASNTIDGISSNLASHSTTMSRLQARSYIENAFEYVGSLNKSINAINPNNYLWKYTDRFFDIDVNDSSLLIEDETIPFIQLILNNTMELYSTYCNFSFYDEKSICTMIDYNMYPSFMLTNDSAYYLLDTNSCRYFSTQYSEYKNLINNIYGKVNQALSQVKGANWINREKVGNIVTNTYSNGKKIVIDYNNNTFEVI